MTHSSRYGEFLIKTTIHKKTMHNTEPAHILVVDDDDKLRMLLTQFLSEQGYIVTYAHDAADARRLLDVFSVDLVLLDVMMPKEKGTVLARELYQKGAPPVLLLTALGAPQERIEGLETGADDYVVKPFAPKELLLRIHTIVRRSSAKIRAAQLYRFGPYCFDTTTGKLSKGEETLYLTTAETQCMRALAAQAGQPVARETLAALCAEGQTIASARSVDVLINRLRKKIEVKPARAVYIQTIRHAGYALMIDEVVSEHGSI